MVVNVILTMYIENWILRTSTPLRLVVTQQFLDKLCVKSLLVRGTLQPDCFNARTFGVVSRRRYRNDTPFLYPKINRVSFGELMNTATPKIVPLNGGTELSSQEGLNSFSCKSIVMPPNRLGDKTLNSPLILHQRWVLSPQHSVRVVHAS